MANKFRMQTRSELPKNNDSNKAPCLYPLLGVWNRGAIFRSITQWHLPCLVLLRLLSYRGPVMHSMNGVVVIAIVDCIIFQCMIAARSTRASAYGRTHLFAMPCIERVAKLSVVRVSPGLAASFRLSILPSAFSPILVKRPVGIRQTGTAAVALVLTSLARGQLVVVVNDNIFFIVNTTMPPIPAASNVASAGPFDGEISIEFAIADASPFQIKIHIYIASPGAIPGASPSAI
eukprot:747789_1